MVKAILILARINLTVPTGGLMPNLVPMLTHPTSSLASYRILLALPHTTAHCITADLLYPALSLPDHCMFFLLSEISFIFLYLAFSGFRACN